MVVYVRMHNLQILQKPMHFQPLLAPKEKMKLWVWKPEKAKSHRHTWSLQSLQVAGKLKNSEGKVSNTGMTEPIPVSLRNTSNNLLFRWGEACLEEQLERQDPNWAEKEHWGWGWENVLMIQRKDVPGPRIRGKQKNI